MKRDDTVRMMPELHFLVFLEGDTLVAAGLESDIGAQEKSFEALMDRLALTIDAESPMATETDGFFPPVKTGQARAFCQEVWDDVGRFGVTRVAVSILEDTYRVVIPGIDAFGHCEPA